MELEDKENSLMNIDEVGVFPMNGSLQPTVKDQITRRGETASTPKKQPARRGETASTPKKQPARRGETASTPKKQPARRGETASTPKKQPARRGETASTPKKQPARRGETASTPKKQPARHGETASTPKKQPARHGETASTPKKQPARRGETASTPKKQPEKRGETQKTAKKKLFLSDNVSSNLALNLTQPKQPPSDLKIISINKHMQLVIEKVMTGSAGQEQASVRMAFFQTGVLGELSSINWRAGFYDLNYLMRMAQRLKNVAENGVREKQLSPASWSFGVALIQSLFAKQSVVVNCAAVGNVEQVFDQVVGQLELQSFYLGMDMVFVQPLLLESPQERVIEELSEQKPLASKPITSSLVPQSAVSHQRAKLDAEPVEIVSSVAWPSLVAQQRASLLRLLERPELLRKSASILLPTEGLKNHPLYFILEITQYSQCDFSLRADFIEAKSLHTIARMPATKVVFENLFVNLGDLLSRLLLMKSIMTEPQFQAVGSAFLRSIKQQSTVPFKLADPVTGEAIQQMLEKLLAYDPKSEKIKEKEPWFRMLVGPTEKFSNKLENELEHSSLVLKKHKALQALPQGTPYAVSKDGCASQENIRPVADGWDEIDSEMQAALAGIQVTPYKKQNKVVSGTSLVPKAKRALNFSSEISSDDPLDSGLARLFNEPLALLLRAIEAGVKLKKSPTSQAVRSARDQLIHDLRNPKSSFSKGTRSLQHLLLLSSEKLKQSSPSQAVRNPWKQLIDKLKDPYLLNRKLLRLTAIAKDSLSHWVLNAFLKTKKSIELQELLEEAQSKLKKVEKPLVPPKPELPKLMKQELLEEAEDKFKEVEKPPTRPKLESPKAAKTNMESHLNLTSLGVLLGGAGVTVVSVAFMISVALYSAEIGTALFAWLDLGTFLQSAIASLHLLGCYVCGALATSSGLSSSALACLTLYSAPQPVKTSKVVEACLDPVDVDEDLSNFPLSNSLWHVKPQQTVSLVSKDTLDECEVKLGQVALEV